MQNKKEAHGYLRISLMWPSLGNSEFRPCIYSRIKKKKKQALLSYLKNREKTTVKGGHWFPIDCDRRNSLLPPYRTGVHADNSIMRVSVTFRMILIYFRENH